MRSSKSYEGFSLALALFDALPVLFFGISVILLGLLLKSPLFVIGAVLAFCAGASKVLWKLLLVCRKRDIRLLFIQLRIWMPVGFLLMLVGILMARGTAAFQYLLQSATELPVSAFLLTGLLGLLLMGVFAFVLDGHLAKTNWIEQSTNAAAQLAILLGIALMFSFSDYYRADDTALQALSTTAAVAVEQTEDLLAFSPTAETAQVGIIFYPGAKVEYTAYAPLMQALAQEGICCFALRMPLNFGFFGMNRAAAVISAHPEITRWYTAGHSLGGVCAAAYASKHTAEVNGTILLASYSTASLQELGVLSIYGSEDGVLNREAYEKYRSNLPAGAVETELAGANHAQFGSYGPQQGDRTAAITAEEQLSQTVLAIRQFCLGSAS